MHFSMSTVLIFDMVMLPLEVVCMREMDPPLDFWRAVSGVVIGNWKLFGSAALRILIKGVLSEKDDLEPEVSF